MSLIVVVLLVLLLVGLLPQAGLHSLGYAPASALTVVVVVLLVLLLLGKL